MIISLSKKFVFVHIHKCAGESVEIACAPQLAHNDILIGAGSTQRQSWISDRILERMTGLRKHSSAEDIMNRIGGQDYGRFKSFAIVRQPDARVYSLYKYCIGQVRESHTFQAVMDDTDLKTRDWAETVVLFWKKLGYDIDKAPALMQQQTFNDEAKFLNAGPFTWNAVKAVMCTTNFGDFLKTSFLNKDEGFRSQRSMLCEASSGKMLVEKIVKLEELSQEWPDLSAFIGISGELPGHNISKDEGVPAMTSGARNWLHKHFADDFQYFKY